MDIPYRRSLSAGLVTHCAVFSPLTESPAITAACSTVQAIGGIIFAQTSSETKNDLLGQTLRLDNQQRFEEMYLC